MSPKLDLIGLIVRSMPAALDFYRALGFDIPAERNGDGHVEIALDNGLRFAWDTIEVIHSFDPDWEPAAGGHRVGLAFLCSSPTDVDATYDRLTGMGYHGHKSPFDAFWGQRYAQVEDPDGNIVDLFAPLS
ncbi:MAG: VOC family protein [Anaerolineae bacterium]|nr:VOC family protein [Anaerolineae bacterium]